MDDSAAGPSGPVEPPRSAPSTDRPPAHPPATVGAGAPGLTAAGVAVVVFAASLVGMLLDTFTGGGVGWLFGGFFVAGSAYAALQVRPSDLPWAVIVPPLVFAVLVVPHGAFTAVGGLLSKVVAGLNDLLDYGPILWIGTGVALAIVLVRVWRMRRAPRP